MGGSGYDTLVSDHTSEEFNSESNCENAKEF